MDTTAQAAGLPVYNEVPAARRRARPDHVVDDAERARIIRRLRWLARLLDDSIPIPGTTKTIGLDPVIGLVPGFGDALSLGISAYIIYEGRRLGASRETLAMMVANVAVDALIGTVPVLGDLADMAFKANQRNLRLLGIEPAGPTDTL